MKDDETLCTACHGRGIDENDMTCHHCHGTGYEPDGFEVEDEMAELMCELMLEDLDL